MKHVELAGDGAPGSDRVTLHRSIPSGRMHSPGQPSLEKPGHLSVVMVIRRADTVSAAAAANVFEIKHSYVARFRSSPPYESI